MPADTQLPAESRRGGRWLLERIEKKGLRPRYAAYVVIASWTVAIIVFGVVERLVDPETFGSIWLGIWWATRRSPRWPTGTSFHSRRPTMGRCLGTVERPGNASRVRRCAKPLPDLVEAFKHVDSISRGASSSPGTRCLPPNGSVGPRGLTGRLSSLRGGRPSRELLTGRDRRRVRAVLLPHGRSTAGPRRPQAESRTPLNCD